MAIRQVHQPEWGTKRPPWQPAPNRFGCPASPSPGSASVSPALDRATGIGVAVSRSAGGTPALPARGWVASRPSLLQLAFQCLDFGGEGVEKPIAGVTACSL